MACEGCPRAFEAVVEFDVDLVFESDDELAEMRHFPFWWHNLDVHPWYCLPCCVAARCSGRDEVVKHGGRGLSCHPLSNDNDHSYSQLPGSALNKTKRDKETPLSDRDVHVVRRCPHSGFSVSRRLSVSDTLTLATCTPPTVMRFTRTLWWKAPHLQL